MTFFQPNLKFSVLGTLWAIGIAVLVLDYGSPFRDGFSYAQFWLGILFCVVPVLLLLLDKTLSSRRKVFVLFMWGATLYLPKVLRSPNFLNLQDEILHFQTLKLIYESGTLDINPTIFEVSMYYPGLELLALPLKLVTHLSIFSTALLLIGLIHSLSPVFIFLILKKIASSERIAFLGAFVFTTNTSYFYFDSMFSYESLGIFLVVVLVFLILKKGSEASALIFSSLSMVILSALVITHHFSSYMFLLFLIILVAVHYYKHTISKESTGKKSIVYFALLTITFISTWLTYVATISIDYLGGLLSDRLQHILSFSMFGEQRPLFWQSPLPAYEVFIDYLYIPLILLLSGLGVYFIRKENKKRNIFVDSLIVYGPLLYFLSLSLIPMYSQDIAYRSWPFLFIGVSFAVAYTLNKMIRQRSFLIKTFTLCVVILVTVAGISLGDNESGRFPGSQNLVSGPAAITSDVVFASNWFEGKAGRYNTVVGDFTIRWVFGGYGVQNVTSWEAWKVFFPQKINNNVMSFLRIYNIDYVIADKRMTEFLAKYKFYFSRGESDIEGHLGYGLDKPLPRESLDKFDDSVFFTRVYSNGVITIYKIKS